MKPYLFLALAVLFETFGLACLHASQQFTRLWPALGVFLGFGSAIWFFMLVLKYFPLGITYSLWSGLVVSSITLTGWLVFGQKIDWPAVAGIALIVAGIAVINLFSKAVLD